MTTKQKAIDKLISLGWSDIDAIEAMNAGKVAQQAYAKQAKAMVALYDITWSGRDIFDAVEDELEIK